MKSTERPRFCCSDLMRFATSNCVVTSSAVVGSSASNRRGSVESAAVMATRWSITEQDIAKLFAAGLVPGILTVVLYFLVVRCVTTLWPEAGPPADRASWAKRFGSLRRTFGVLVLFLLIIGGLFFGVFTATEAGGIGAVGALCFALLRKKMSIRAFVGSLFEAAETTAMIFAVAFGALVLNQFINLVRHAN